MEPIQQHNNSISFHQIQSTEATYTLRQPLDCHFYKEKDYFVIEFEPFGLIGTGNTVEEATSSFFDEFDFVYQRYNSLQDNQLSLRNQTIKAEINSMVSLCR